MKIALAAAKAFPPSDVPFSFAHMLPPFRRKPDNAWIESDRRERTKLVLATLTLVAALAGGIGFAVYAIVAH
ncbi:MAG: hypothetical protein HZA32_00975 [Opitutae bacterium]|nr:hypothetical protein [Opitutae bacterium]